MRLVSLLPSATEIVYALGLGEDLVGVTFECDEPPEARSEKTVVVGGRDTSGMTPGEIDDYVRAQMAAGADLYTLHAKALADLRPELILTQDLCRVCALPSGHVEQALSYLGCQADVLSLDPYSLDEVLESILAVGLRTRVPDRAERLVSDLRARLARTAAAVAGRRRPAAAVIEWVDPPFAAGHWIPDLVSAAGGRPVAARPGAGCTYCFARPTHEFLGLGVGEDFERRIVVKVNAVELARVELSSPRWGGDLIAMGTNTDPYQPAEGKYHLTQGIISALSQRGNPFSILTKSTLVLRDLRQLAEASRRTLRPCQPLHRHPRSGGVAADRARHAPASQAGRGRQSSQRCWSGVRRAGRPDPPGVV